MNIEKKQYESIRDFLRIEVPREIQAVIDRGGVNNTDWAWLTQEINDDLQDLRPLNILMRADEYLLYPSSAKKAEQGWLIFRKAIALLSFVPGGIHIFGLHFGLEVAEFVEDDEW